MIEEEEFLSEELKKVRVISVVPFARSYLLVAASSCMLPLIRMNEY